MLCLQEVILTDERIQVEEIAEDLDDPYFVFILEQRNDDHTEGIACAPGDRNY